MKNFLITILFVLFMLPIKIFTTTGQKSIYNYRNVIAIKMEQLCRTWVSFEGIGYEPMMGRSNPFTIDKENRDTIAFFKDGIFTRHEKLEKTNGLWEIINDSTVSTDISTPVSKHVYVRFLSDSTLTMSFPWGREGEHRVVKYKPSLISITK